MRLLMAAKYDMTARHHAQRYPIDPTALLTFIGLTHTKHTYLNFPRQFYGLLLCQQRLEITVELMWPITTASG
ncbi:MULTISPECIES: hypothetical protein [unclassified Pseudomonas]|uniref:hypothetical protein n=1 Tax=unclassified Pseudomonas TaxID=196821 RepID=UPI00381E0C1B